MGNWDDYNPTYLGFWGAHLLKFQPRISLSFPNFSANDAARSASSWKPPQKKTGAKMENTQDPVVTFCWGHAEMRKCVLRHVIYV